MFSYFSLIAFCNMVLACHVLSESAFCFTLIFILLMFNEKNPMSLNTFPLFLYKERDVLYLPICFL